MDDAQTQNYLDALAELYLTGVSSSSAKNNPPSPDGKAPVRSTLADELDPADTPAPIRLAPKVRTPGTPGRSPHFASVGSPAKTLDIGHGTLDSSAKPLASASSLTRHRRPQAPDSKSATQDPRLQTLDVQSVVLASLPGFSGPWLTQYAHHLAQERGPVLLVHLDDEHIELELVRASAPVNFASPATTSPNLHLADESVSPSKPSPASLDESPVQTIDQLLEHPTDPVRTLLIHLHDIHAPQRLEPARRLRRCTVLCGAYDPAIVEAYRLILRLAGADPQQEQSTPTQPWTGQVDLFIMGSDQQRSLDAVSKLNSSAARHLSQPVRLLGCLKQMVPVNAQSLARFPATDQHLSDLLAYLDELSSRTPAPGIPETPETPEVSPEIPTQTLDLGHGTLDTPGTPATPGSPHFASVGTPPTLEPPQPTPAQAQASAPNAGTPAMEQELDLSRFLAPDSPAGAGVIPLQARCPKHPQTQIVLDQEGCLHLLRRHDSTAAQAGLSDLRLALVDLLEARNWVCEHLNLLQMTQRQCRLDPQLQPKLHLFTNQAKAAVALGQSFSVLVQLHLLSPVQVGASTAWFSQELT